MALMANRRSVMTLFSDPTSAYSHQARMVLMEKGITVDIVDIDPADLPEDLIDLNPYHTVPTLVDRDLVLYHPQIIMEYLDERFPHPPLMPVDPVSRARSRLALYRLEHDWYALAEVIEEKGEKGSAKERKMLRDSIVASDDIFAASPFFLSDELTLVDCAVTPLLWRLPRLGIELPPQAKAVAKYMDRMFRRPAFRLSLTEPEREMRD